MKRTECIVGISGDYVAWHEIYPIVVYVFGRHGQPLSEEFNDWLVEEKKIDATGITNFDTLATEWIDNFVYNGDGFDYRVCECIIVDDEVFISI